MVKRVSKKQYIGDCSPKGIAKKAIYVTKNSKVKNPIKTGNLLADIAIGRIPVAKYWNRGYNIGRWGFIAKQTYDETCKRKK